MNLHRNQSRLDALAEVHNGHIAWDPSLGLTGAMVLADGAHPRPDVAVELHELRHARLIAVDDTTVSTTAAGAERLSEWQDRFKVRAIEDHAEAVLRGEHDDQCEWRADGFYVCNCSKRRRERQGRTTPPGELIHQAPLCPGCDEEIYHDGDSYTCPRCCVDWDEHGVVARFYDDHGDLSADLAKWEAAQAERAARSVEVPDGQ